MHLELLKMFEHQDLLDLGIHDSDDVDEHIGVEMVHKDPFPGSWARKI